MTHLELVRLIELDLIIDEINRLSPVVTSILEIGGGAGWQAKKLSEAGFEVESIDMPQSIYANARVWPITDYDGKRIPFPDDSFDIVFSSSALEHIPHLGEFQNEMKRVLKTNGLAMHIVPSGGWRFWTILMHYPFIVKMLAVMSWRAWLGRGETPTQNELESLARTQIRQLSKLGLLKKAILPQRHGERGSALSEIYYFSRKQWYGHFEQSGWFVDQVFSNRIAYSGYVILGRLLSIPCRRQLSRILGSACHVFILRKVRPEQVGSIPTVNVNPR